MISELALSGETRPIAGVLARAMQAAAENRDRVLVRSVNALEEPPREPGSSNQAGMFTLHRDPWPI
jgi:hypothetical protein